MTYTSHVAEVQAFNYHLDRIIDKPNKKGAVRAPFARPRHGTCCITRRQTDIVDLDIVANDGSYIRIGVDSRLLSIREAIRALRQF
jgi:hypothetical protein